MAENPTSSSTMYTTLGAPSGALGGSNGAQSGTESRISTLIVPLNGWLIFTPGCLTRPPHVATTILKQTPTHRHHPNRMSTVKIADLLNELKDLDAIHCAI